MEFGRIPQEEINTVNFSLPADPVFNQRVLNGKKVKDPKIYVGCAPLIIRGLMIGLTVPSIGLIMD